MAEEAKWYVVHTYSGYENAVSAAIMKAAENRRMTVRGATGFVGADGKAIPLTEKEIYDLGVEVAPEDEPEFFDPSEQLLKIVVNYAVGDEVRVKEGPFAGHNGVVSELEPERNRVRVVITMFGRETPLDMELDQVEVIK